MPSLSHDRLRHLAPLLASPPPGRCEARCAVCAAPCEPLGLRLRRDLPRLQGRRAGEPDPRSRWRD